MLDICRDKVELKIASGYSGPLHSFLKCRNSLRNSSFIYKGERQQMGIRYVV